jgi:signal peptidase I
MSSHASEDPQAEEGSGAAPALSADPPATETPSAAAPSTSVPRHRRSREKQGALAFLRELPVLLLVAFVLALLIKTFLVQAFFIPSASMEPTLQIGDRVLVNKVPYHFHPPRRGDIIVFSDPHPAATEHRNAVSAFFHWLTEGLGVSNNPEKDFIKRVIGLPGDTVEIDDRGTVFVNGKALTEPYISPVHDNRPYGPIHVPPKSLFVLGDNRTLSNDSRFGLGFIPYDKVVGRAFVIIWPPSRVRWLHGG